ncbi:hypothetical protein FRC07_011224 [Ceratobasidium sp. 392]|nr:hypothetical protein FRC07_011224 [Ceratobasidium sp. 392]
MLIVELVCEAYTALATTRQPGDLRYKEILAEACKRLCSYILASGAGEKLELTHKPLLRFLTSVGPTIVEISYEDTKEPQSRPNHRVLVEKVIQEIIVIVEGAEEGLKDQTELRGHFGSTKLKYMLDFLAILLHSSASAANGPPDKRPTLEHLQWSMLRTSSLLLLGFAYGHFKKRNSPTTDRFPDHEQDTFLEVVLDDKGDWLLETCALARYMIATEDIRILDDPVAMLGVWSQIRDTLLATLQRRFVAEQEPIAVAISGTLCASLVSILHTVGKQTRRMILASPWTQTLRVALEEVQTQNGGLDDFGLGLRRQLERPAEVLLHKIAGDECHALEDSVHLVCVDVAGWLQIVPMFVAASQ